MFEFCEQVGHFFTKLAPVDDHVDRAVIEQKLAALKSFR
jgi:hypothetical protein